MHPPFFAADEAALAELGRHAKHWRCPHCGRSGGFNAHGNLRGLAERGPGKAALRGRRFLCSNRGRRPGCGRTWSVRLARVLRGLSVRTAQLWRFALGWLSDLAPLAAWVQACTGFSLESAHRWRRRWRRAEPALRTWLCRGREPPDANLPAALVGAYGVADPIAGLQAREQRGWPGFGS
ncbi:MAG: hypothetical protein QM691_15265 [Opitutaceae bacterium]